MARQIQLQNVTIDEIGQPILSKGVAKARRISIEDPPDMRHGRKVCRGKQPKRRALRKSRSQRFDGYKRHHLLVGNLTEAC
ncbi:hypothetical protein DP113_29270 [Brasilonema octagenarum UFV-E1]|uniref:Uncharacterized protein n=2 Tax=Brasilonema TaxID=383614 RepID=A0A856MLJ3_9CYAN|nr:MULTISPECIES: hypothetical protein [Brasilonema]NMF63770.1 hypothetical protein [Brasilonema octagenarum UFV-OR1]QDL11412.1 hypothetical protein DP114_29075 [Brasilonema sennae CENA114]QDL17803.1 hypothetical protein DP113_29270 [Brasilonema octagenarum UFV-E1]